MTVSSSGVTSLTSLVATTADIDAGTIDNTTVGVTTPAVGRFSTLTSEGTLTVNSGMTMQRADNPLQKTFDLVGAENQDQHLFNVAKFGSNNDKLTIDYLGTTTIADLVATTADINAGTIDATVVGASTPAAASFTSLTTQDSVTVNAGMSIDGDDTLETTLNVKGMAFQSAQNPFFNVQDAASDNKLTVGSDGVTTVKSLVATTADINAGTIDNTVIGATTPADATFSTVTVNDSLVLNTHLAIAGSSNNTTLGVTGTLNQTANLFNVSRLCR